MTDKKPLSFFLSLLDKIRTDILESFILPEVGVSYWKYVIGLAIAAVVITVLVNVVRVGSVSYSTSKERVRQRDIRENRYHIRSSKPKITFGKRVQ